MLITALGWAAHAFAFNDVDQRGEFDADLLKIEESLYLGHDVPDVAVETNQGTQHLSTLIADQPTVLLFAYYTCGHTCPVLIQNLSRLPVEMPTDKFRVLVLSFDEKDHLGSMRHLKSTLDEIPDNWTFGLLSGEESARLTSAVGFKYFFSERDQTFVHPTVMIMLSPEGKVMRYLYGAEPRARDVELALIESRDRVSHLNEIVDMFKLTCFHFDAARSRYVVHPTLIFGGLGIGVLSIAGLATLASRKNSKGGP